MANAEKLPNFFRRHVRDLKREEHASQFLAEQHKPQSISLLRGLIVDLLDQSTYSLLTNGTVPVILSEQNLGAILEEDLNIREATIERLNAERAGHKLVDHIEIGYQPARQEGNCPGGMTGLLNSLLPTPSRDEIYRVSFISFNGTNKIIDALTIQGNNAWMCRVVRSLDDSKRQPPSLGIVVQTRIATTAEIIKMTELLVANIGKPGETLYKIFFRTPEMRVRGR